MADRRLRSYWNCTSSYRAVKDLIDLNMAGMKDDVSRMVSGGSVPLNVSRFENTPARIYSKDDAFTYLCHLGYLAYDSEDETCRIPNDEVRNEWVNSIEDDQDYAPMVETIRSSKALLKSAWGMDAKALRQGS